MKLRLSELKKIIVTEIRQSLREGLNDQYSQDDIEFDNRRPKINRTSGYEMNKRKKFAARYYKSMPTPPKGHHWDNSDAGYAVLHWHDMDGSTNTYDYVDAFSERDLQDFEKKFGNGIDNIVKAIDQKAVSLNISVRKVINMIADEIEEKTNSSIY